MIRNYQFWSHRKHQIWMQNLEVLVVSLQEWNLGNQLVAHIKSYQTDQTDKVKEPILTQQQQEQEYVMRRI